jgi:hypothetical protein
MPGGYVVRDANGQALACIYSRANQAEALQAKVLMEDEARRIAANIAKLPGVAHAGGMIGGRRVNFQVVPLPPGFSTISAKRSHASASA